MRQVFRKFFSQLEKNNCKIGHTIHFLCVYILDPPPNDLDLSQLAIIVACVVSILIFALAVVLLCESR
jgi:hypothetical protein